MNLRSLARVLAVLFAVSATAYLTIRAQRSAQPNVSAPTQQEMDSGDQHYGGRTVPIDGPVSGPASVPASLPEAVQDRPTLLYSSKFLVVEDLPGNTQEEPELQLTDEQIFMFSSKSAPVDLLPEPRPNDKKENPPAQTVDQ